MKKNRKNQEADKQQMKTIPLKEVEEQEPMPEDLEEGMQEGGRGMIIRRLALVVLILAIIVCAFLFLVSGTNYNGYEVIEETDVKNATMVDYVPYQNSLLKYSKDGAVYVDEKDKTVWNETFAMKMPAADVSGEYAAIADMNGNDVYIFNTEGKVSSTTMPYRICDVAVAAQGEFAVILEGKKENYINIYDKNGEQISEIQTTIDKSGYPMDIDLSENGEKLFSSYFNLDGAEAKYGLAAYNFGAVGQSENADRLVGGYQLDNTVIPKVEFLDNNTVCAFGDKQFIIYSMREKPSEKTKIVFDGEVKSVVFNSEYIGVVVPNDADVKDGDKKAPYVLMLYNLNGRKVMTKNIDFDYDNVRMIGEEIVFTGGTECRIYTVKGKQKFSYTFQKNVMDLIPTGYGRRYIVLYDSGSEVIRLKHDRRLEK